MISTARQIIVDLTDFRTELELHVYNNRFHIWTSVPSGHHLTPLSINHVRNCAPSLSNMHGRRLNAVIHLRIVIVKPI